MKLDPDPTIIPVNTLSVQTPTEDVSTSSGKSPVAVNICTCKRQHRRIPKAAAMKYIFFPFSHPPKNRSISHSIRIPRNRMPTNTPAIIHKLLRSGLPSLISFGYPLLHRDDVPVATMITLNNFMAKFVAITQSFPIPKCFGNKFDFRIAFLTKYLHNAP